MRPDPPGPDRPGKTRPQKVSVSASAPQAAVWVAIPVYNNSATVRRVVVDCLAIIGRVVVVDDGSDDSDMAALLAGLDITLLRHEKNMGKGSAILTASRHIEAQGGVYMITIDADGQHHPEDIRKFIPLLPADGHKMIVGSRDFGGPNIGPGSRFGRRFANFWMKLETGVYVDDCQSGFRAYPVQYLNQITFHRQYYDFEAEALARMSWAGIQIEGVDIGVTYPPKGQRVSHFRPFMDNLRLTLTHSRLIGRRLLPIPHKTFFRQEPVDYKSLLHPVKLIRALLRENATPEGLAASAAVGIFLATLPLLFFHSVAILYVASRLNLNKLLAFNVQHICMPPVVPALCIEIGYYIRNGTWLTDLSHETVFIQFGDRLLEWLIGSLIVGPVLAILAAVFFYFLALGAKRWKATRP